MDMYMEEILDHYKHPHNNEELTTAQIIKEDSNPLCGDEQTIYIQIDEDQIIKKITFKGKGCAISVAATSMLTDELVGKTLEEVLKIENDFIFELLGVQISAMRVKCALLGLKTSQRAIKEYLDNNNNNNEK